MFLPLRNGLIAICFLIFAFTTLAAAQELSISGTVRDSSAALMGANVTLRDSSGNTTNMTTDTSGQYNFKNLRPGSYELAVSRSGFATATTTLALASEGRVVDITLQVAGVSTSIDVNDVAGHATASGMEVPNREIPSYVVSVSAKTLEEQAINDLPSALENVSGVMTQVQYGVYEWYTVGGITQQSGNDFLYVDGMALTGNRSLTQLTNIQEVQVLKGPNSILYGGSGAGQGGMINLIRKKPSVVRSHEIRYRAGFWGLQEISGGSTGSVLKGESQRLLYRLDGSYSHRDGWRQSGANRFNISPAFTWLISSRMRVTANETFIRDRYTLDAGLRMELVNRPGFPFDRKMNPDADFQLTRDWQNQITYSWNITDRLMLTDTFFKRINRDQYLDAETMSYNAALDQVNRGYLYFQHNRRPLQNIVDLTGDYVLKNMRHRFLVRYDYSDQYNFTNRTGNTPGSSNANLLPLPPVPVGAFIAGTWVDTAPVYTNFPITRVDYSDNRYHGFVFQDQVNPVRWLGVNFVISPRTYLRQTHNDNYNNGAFVSRGADVRFENTVKPNYRAGAALIPQENWNRFIRGFQPYFSYNSSFNPVNQVQADGTPLDPVINQSFEVGNKWQGLDKRLSILTAARRIQDQNRVISLGNGFFEQVGKATTYNVDLDIEGNAGHGVWILANYGFADGLIDRLRTDGLPQTNGGKRFPQAPKHTSRIWVTKNLKISDETSLTFSLGARYVGRYFANTANTAIVPSRGTMDGAVSIDRGKYAIAVNFANLLNKEKYFVSQINSGGQLYPGQPFNATVSVRYRFR